MLSEPVVRIVQRMDSRWRAGAVVPLLWYILDTSTAQLLLLLAVYVNPIHVGGLHAEATFQLHFCRSYTGTMP